MTSSSEAAASASTRGQRRDEFQEIGRRRRSPSSAAAGFPTARRGRDRASRPARARQGRSRRWTSHQARTRRAISRGFKAASRAVYECRSWNGSLTRERAMTKPARQPRLRRSARLAARRRRRADAWPRAASARRASSPTGPRSSAPTIAALRAADQIQWPPRGAKRDPDEPAAPATLVLRIDGAFALEAQHAGGDHRRARQRPSGLALRRKVAFRQGPLRN